MKSLILPALLLLPTALCAAEPTLPTFDPAAFRGGLANPFMPLIPGTGTTMLGIRADGTLEKDVMQVTGPGPTILGVATIQVRDEGYDNDRLMERTLDYYAPDASGNLWYFGEDVTNYSYDAAGTLAGTDSHSSWRAGVDGALPGILLLAAPKVGAIQFQEHAPNNEAMDYGEVVATGLSLTVAGKTYEGVLQTFDASLADPDLREHKFYAPGVGMIRAEEELSPARTNPAITFDLQP